MSVMSPTARPANCLLHAVLLPFQPPPVLQQSVPHTHARTQVDQQIHIHTIYMYIVNVGRDMPFLVIEHFALHIMQLSNTQSKKK